MVQVDIVRRYTMSDNTIFFDSQTEQSEIKAKIVSSYFASWSRIIKNNWDKNIPIAYIDLFCGPGVYADGSESVPVKIVRTVLDDPGLSSRIIIAFNDEDPRYIENLRQIIEKVDSNESLKGRIMFSCEKIDNSFYNEIEIDSNIPILSFIDPFGYRGITRELIKTLIKNNGSDCIFFFNYNRINMALSQNSKFDIYLTDFFGEERMLNLKKELSNKTPKEREIEIVNATIEALRELGECYPLPFKFYRTDMHRTSHFIVFVSKHTLGYSIMKNIMASVSAKDESGVPLFEYHDTFNFGDDLQQLTLTKTKMEELCDMLIAANYRGPQNIKQLCQTYENILDTPYIASNVKEALRRLEEQGLVVITGRKRMISNGKKTMPDTAFATFNKI